MAKRLFVLLKTHLYLGEEAVVKTFAACWSQPSVHCPSRLIQRSQMFIAPWLFGSAHCLLPCPLRSAQCLLPFPLGSLRVVWFGLVFMPFLFGSIQTLLWAPGMFSALPAERSVYCPVRLHQSSVYCPSSWINPMFLALAALFSPVFIALLAWISSLFIFYLLGSAHGNLLYCRYQPNVYCLARLDHSRLFVVFLFWSFVLYSELL